MGSLYIHFILLIFYFYFSAATWAVDFSPNSKSVEEVLALIAEEHPEAKSLEYLMHSHKLHMEASGILPDPKIGVVYKNYPARNGYALNDRQLDTPTMTGVEFSVSQEFPFSGKLSSEQKISKFTEREASLTYVSGINQIFWDFLSKLNRFQRLKNKMKLNRKTIDLLSAQKNVAQGYYSSGNISLADAFKPAIAKTESLERETEYATNLKDLSSQLSYFQIGDRLSKNELSSLDLDSYFKENEYRVLSLQGSIENSATENPDYKAFLVEEKRLKESVRLSKFSILPQTEVFVSYIKRKSQTFALDRGPLDYRLMDTTEYKGDLFSFGVTMKVPFWSALKWGSITGQYEKQADAGKESAEKARKQIVSELQRNFELIRGVGKQLEILQKQLIPELEKSVQANSNLYLPGKTKLQDALVAQVEVINAKIRKEDLYERKNESILNILRLLSLFYPRKETGLYFEHDHKTRKNSKMSETPAPSLPSDPHPGESL
ncbi:TolC family protein [Leptospira borgpetersenii]|uniref:Outer membrane efflux protein n=1 Tax=Leptospira borgpetersenii serovar Ballum TaxID=280505 RepID=A0A0E3BP63_LEPBO|nr:TolC family protein [Leptospira borgpetersenii]ALO25642.1 outer membrane efflux protein [Leptospira borgpetersenii serovar Ballum]APY24866.1 Outer membrane efflux protein [Leptospira borgpetersenii str. 4E]EKR00769.1 outer membrane efflux protein [Leptospira borgpetersenii serovar Castellonis str. 200801910]KGE24186.1 transporter [Leptospira borgpetersenii serovar Ballum]MBE8161461.1 TolC family protein [Leptospira borgpetersenii serovar Ballum]